MHSLFYIRYKKFYLKLNILGLKLDLSAYNLFIFIKSILSFYNYKAFLKILQQEKKSFVVIELNSFHGEILTPWHHCLKELDSNNKILFLFRNLFYFRENLLKEFWVLCGYFRKHFSVEKNTCLFCSTNKAYKQWCRAFYCTF